MLKFRYTILLGVLISILSLVPGDRLPESPVKYTDLAVHVCMYAAWMFVLGREARRQYPGYSARLLIKCLLIMMAYGGLVEYLQETYVPGRFGSWTDFLANAAGALISFTVFFRKSAS